MMRAGTVVLGLVSLTLAAYAPALASPDTEPFEEKCGTAPFGPDIPNEAAMSDAKIAELKADVVAFIKSSDQFQECIDRTLVQGPKLKKNTPPEQVTAIQDRFARTGVKIMADNQAEKERVGDAFNALIDLRKTGGGTAAAKPAASVPAAPEGAQPVAAKAAGRATSRAKPLEKPTGL